MADYAIFMLDPQGRVVSWNEGAERIKGWRPEELLGEHLSRFYLPEEVAAGAPARTLAVASCDGRFEDEGWRLRKDGSRCWANVVVTAIYDDAGALQGRQGDPGPERAPAAGAACPAGGAAGRAGTDRQGVVRADRADLFAVGLELQAATFADDTTLWGRVDAAVQHLDQVIVDLRSHVFQLHNR